MMSKGGQDARAPGSVRLDADPAVVSVWSRQVSAGSSQVRAPWPSLYHPKRDATDTTTRHTTAALFRSSTTGDAVTATAGHATSAAGRATR